MRLEPRLGHNKAIVAVARKLLVTIWHVLSKGVADQHAEPERVAHKFVQVAYTLGKTRRPKGQTAGAYARQRLDRLGIGQDLSETPWGEKKKPIPMPPSSLPSLAS